MKKKFLSLMMAAAVVATTSVSAFASSDATVSENGGSVDVKITGAVNGPNDTPPEGTISVTIPTTLAFTVNNAGEVKGTSLDVKNNGTEDVEIYAYEFIDGNGGLGIEAVKKTSEGIAGEKTNKVVLNLEGNAGTAGLVSTGNTKGIYDAKNTSAAEQSNADGVKIASLGKLGGQNTGTTINLTGFAGKNKEGVTALTEQFTVKLKVKKVKKTTEAGQEGASQEEGRHNQV